MSDTPARLITNLSYVTVYVPGAEIGVRTHASALILSVDDDAFGSSEQSLQKVTGFGSDGALPMFSLRLNAPVLEYESSDHAGNVIMLRDNGEAVPVNQTVVLSWSDGYRLQLSIDDYEQPIDFMDYGPPTFPEIWPVLRRKVLEYHRAPFAPVLSHIPTETARLAAKYAGVS